MRGHLARLLPGRLRMSLCGVGTLDLGARLLANRKENSTRGEGKGPVRPRGRQVCVRPCLSGELRGSQGRGSSIGQNKGLNM